MSMIRQVTTDHTDGPCWRRLVIERKDSYRPVLNARVGPNASRSAQCALFLKAARPAIAA